MSIIVYTFSVKCGDLVPAVHTLIQVLSSLYLESRTMLLCVCMCVYNTLASSPGPSQCWEEGLVHTDCKNISKLFIKCLYTIAYCMTYSFLLCTSAWVSVFDVACLSTAQTNSLLHVQPHQCAYTYCVVLHPLSTLL